MAASPIRRHLAVLAPHQIGDCNIKISSFFFPVSSLLSLLQPGSQRPLDNVALPCFQTEICDLTSRSQFLFLACEKFGVLSNTTAVAHRCGWTGLPVRVRRHSTLVAGIRNSRAHGCLMDTPSPSGGPGGKMRLDLVSLWEAVTEIVHCT